METVKEETLFIIKVDKCNRKKLKELTVRRRSASLINKEYEEFSVETLEYYKSKIEKRFDPEVEVELYFQLKRCETCLDFENSNFLLLCEICEDAYHCFCLNPPIFEINNTDNDFMCNRCMLKLDTQRSLTKLEKSLAKNYESCLFFTFTDYGQNPYTFAVKPIQTVQPVFINCKFPSNEEIKETHNSLNLALLRQQCRFHDDLVYRVSPWGDQLSVILRGMVPELSPENKNAFLEFKSRSRKMIFPPLLVEEDEIQVFV